MLFPPFTAPICTPGMLFCTPHSAPLTFSSFPAKVSRYLPPVLRWPFDDRVGVPIVLEPSLSPLYELIELLRLGRASERCAASLLPHPQLSVDTVAVDGHGVQPPLLEQSQTMNNGQKFPNIVRAVDRAKVKNLLARSQIDTTIFHRPRITAASGVDSYGIPDGSSRQHRSRR